MIKFLKNEQTSIWISRLVLPFSPTMERYFLEKRISTVPGALSTIVFFEEFFSTPNDPAIYFILFVISNRVNEKTISFSIK